jgi:UTP--glucose-1-phosphate uridylyltransferase
VDALETLGGGAAPAGAAALDRVVAIKLNGGLATSMGLRRPKSLIEARDGRTFLQILAAQVRGLRRRFGVRLPLVLLDSFATRGPTLDALAGEADLAADLPPDFLQHAIPKLDAATLLPVRWPADPALEWCPPGHGDVYVALQASGLLDRMLARGYRYAFLSNADNLGAVADPRIPAWMEAEAIPFVMEVVLGTEADRKGGHIARLADGRIVLRETAQTPPDDAASFSDFRRWRYYNTNNLWVDLGRLRARLAEGALDLPLIVNRKTVDPRDPMSPAVLQLESAMGAAISSFGGARVVCVDRARFIPVKTTDDLLVLRSDVYRLRDEGILEPTRPGPPPYVALDPSCFRLLEDFESRFPGGPPSLAQARRLVVEGDVIFGAGVVVRGDVTVRGPRRVPAGAVLGRPLPGADRSRGPERGV